MAFVGQALGAGYTSDWGVDPASQTSQLINPVDAGLATSGIQQQQAFLTALQGQNGVANQNAAFQGYQDLANGTGPNVAQKQLAQATEANVANQAAMAAGQRGASQNVGMMSRNAANQGANIQQQAAGQAATLGAQQQMQGLQGMAGISGQQVGNQAGALQGFNQNLLGSIGGYNQAVSGMYGSANKANSDTQLQNSKNQSGMLGGLLSGAGGIFSDERLKKDIKPADDKIKDFLDKAGAHEYSYKPEVEGKPGAKPGKHTGPMAQELEKSEIGKQMVVETPQGKAVDYGQSMGTLIAALSSLNKRLDGLEGGDRAAPKKMADGGVATPAPGQPTGVFGLPQFGGAQKGFANMADPTRSSEQNVMQGTGDFTKAVVDKFVKPYTDPYINSAKQSMSDYFHNETSVDLDNPSVNLENVQNPRGMESLDGTTANVDPFGAPLSSDVSAEAQGMAAQNGTEVASADSGMGMSSLGGAAEGAEGAEAATGAGETVAGLEGAEGLGDAAVLLASKGGKATRKVPAMVSPGEAYIPPHKVNAVAQGKESPRKAGEVIKGKAKIAGDSEKNDTVPKTLQEGGVVIPRTKMKDDDSAARFVQAIMAKSPGRGMKR